MTRYQPSRIRFNLKCIEVHLTFYEENKLGVILGYFIIYVTNLVILSPNVIRFVNNFVYEDCKRFYGFWVSDQHISFHLLSLSECFYRFSKQRPILIQSESVIILRAFLSSIWWSFWENFSNTISCIVISACNPTRFWTEKGFRIDASQMAF